MRVGVLGPLEVATDSGEPVEVSGARLRRLLIRLALSPGQVVTAPALIEAVWDGDPPAGAANALQALVSRLRRALPEAVVEPHAAGYRLMLPRDRVDALRFERLLLAGRAAVDRDPAAAAGTLREALALWRGPALADAADTGFARGPAARLSELRLMATEERIRADLRLVDRDGSPAPADLVAELEALVAEYPLREALTARLMRALALAGRPADALAAYERVRHELAERLGADPSPELSALQVALLRGELGTRLPIADGGRDVVPDGGRPGGARPAVAGGGPGAAPRPVAGNLPAALTSFVGRDAEVATVRDLLAGYRLTTLTGPGGAGKTRLATVVAAGLDGPAPDGAWLVQLAPLTDGAEIPLAVLDALGLREQALLRRRGALPVEEVDPAARLVEALADRRAVLIMDNCEHLLDASAALVDRLLAHCPGMRVLATSREPLGILGESLCAVPPLDLPPDGADAQRASRHAAVRLFIDRAAAVRPGFAVDRGNVAAVVRLCRRLDGIPLAIELAAARLRVLSPEQLAERLDDRFRLLSGGNRTALPRHRTLRAVVDWSWDLLDDSERALWRRMAVFSGAATLEAVAAVCPPAAESTHRGDRVLELVSALVDKSLVQPADGASPRFGMLETIRAYGLERLAEAGETEPVRRAHAGYYLALAERAEPMLRGPEQMTWLRRLAEEHDNLHASLRGAVAAGDAPTAQRLTAALGWYWWLRGHRSEGAALAAQALAVPGEVPPPVRARALVVASMVGMDHTDHVTTLDRIRRAADLIGDERPEHVLLRLVRPVMALIETYATDPATEALARLVVDEDPWAAALGRAIRAYALLNLGRRQAEAAEDLTLALAGFRALDDRWGTAMSLAALGEIASQAGDHERAAEHYAEALSRMVELGTREDMPHFQLRLAHELWLSGRTERVEELIAEAERLAHAVGVADLVASVAYARGEIARAAGDLDAASAHLERAASVMDRARPDQMRAVIECAQGMVALGRGDRATATMKLGEALATAVSTHDAPVIGRVLVGAAALAMDGGDAGGAAALIAAAEAVRGGPDASIPEEAVLREAARAALGADGFARASARGRDTPADALVDLAGLDAAGARRVG